MTIKELIEILDNIHSTHGNIDVMGCVDDIHRNGPDYVKNVEVEKYENNNVVMLT